LTGARQLGIAWLALCAALALHVADEALTDFLSVYNPTVISIREALPWLALPVFGFREWLGGLVVAVTLLLALAPLAFRGAALVRLVAWPLGVLMTLNGLVHLAGSLWWGRVLPGAWSSPLLIACALWLLVAVRRTHGPARS
jgi:hypothetical protein